MPLDPRVEEALHGTDPVSSFQELVRSMQSQGRDQATILDLFEQTRRQLREAGREKDEDVILEVMDFLVGWCSPHMSLEP